MSLPNTNSDGARCLTLKDIVTTSTYFMYISFDLYDPYAKHEVDSRLKEMLRMVWENYPNHDIVIIMPKHSIGFKLAIQAAIKLGPVTYEVLNLNSSNHLLVCVFKTKTPLDSIEYTKWDGTNLGGAGISSVTSCCGSIAVNCLNYPSLASFQQYIERQHKDISVFSITGSTTSEYNNDLLSIFGGTNPTTPVASSYILYRTLKFLPTSWELPTGYEEVMDVCPINKEFNLVIPKQLAAHGDVDLRIKGITYAAKFYTKLMANA